MSLIILDKNKPLPSKFDYDKWAAEKPSDDASALEKDRFWDREMKRWREGHNGIPGRHYAYLTIGTIKTITGKKIAPRWRDYDEFIINEGDKAIKDSQDEIIVKRREYGLSSFYGGFMPVFNGIINHGSTALLTSADKPRVESLFKDKTEVMFFGLDKHIRPDRVAKRAGGYLHMGTVDKMTHEVKGVDSQIICRETADTEESAKSFENYRAMYIFLDELFRHPRASTVVRAAQACMNQGFEKLGHMVLGGSCGENTLEGGQVGEELWYDALALNMKTIFIPGYACIESARELDDNGMPTQKILNFCVNGHSDEKAATEWILKTRDRLSKAKTKSFYDSFVMQYPLTIEEVFESNKKGLFSEEIYAGLKESEKKIKNGEFVEGRYDLVRSGSGVTARPNSHTGKFYIIKPPTDMGEYITGCDPIPFGTAQIDKGSDYSVIVKDRMADQYVAYYAERNLDADEVTENNIKLQEFYKSKAFPHGALQNPEMNRGGVLLEKYKDAGKLHLLCDRLIHLGITYESKHAVKGWYNNDKTGERANNFMITYLKKFSSFIGIKRLIDELRKWPVGNLDLVDAMKSCEMLDKELTEKYKKVYKPPTPVKRRVTYRDEFGRVVDKWI
jgi:hypothetical protein